MKALVLDRAGPEPKLSLVERPVPMPPAGHVVIRVEACGFCHHDALVMAGVLRRGVVSPVVLGHEVAGPVEAVGPEVTGVAPGDPVAVAPVGGLGHAVDGGLAEYVVAPESAVVPVPSGASVRGTCLLGCPLGVAVKGVEEVAQVGAGDTVVVTGVSGGLGVHAAQVAAARGARVIGVTTSPEKLPALEAQPWLWQVAVHGRLPYDREVLALGEQAPQVVIDTVGGALLESGVRALAPGGRLVLLGQIAPGTAAIPVAELLFREGRVLSSLGSQRRHLERAMELVAAGAVTPVVDRELPLSVEGVLEAHRLLRERGVVGRVVIRP